MSAEAAIISLKAFRAANPGVPIPPWLPPTWPGCIDDIPSSAPTPEIFLRWLDHACWTMRELLGVGESNLDPASNYPRGWAFVYATELQLLLLDLKLPPRLCEHLDMLLKNHQPLALWRAYCLLGRIGAWLRGRLPFATPQGHASGQPEEIDPTAAPSDTTDERKPAEGPAIHSDQAGREGSEGTGKGNKSDNPSGATREDRLRQLEPAVRKAYFTYCFAEQKKEKRLTDQEAYECLKDEGLPEGDGGLGELAGYELPSFASWSKYLRTARGILGEQKYTCRTGRPTGKSIVKSDEIETQKEDDQ